MKRNFIAHYMITIGDINAGRHMGNERALLIFQEARICLLHSHGYSEADIGENKGIVVVEAGCRYLKEVFLHDELEIHVSFEKMTSKSFTLTYSATRKQDRQQVFTGFTTILPFDYQLRKAARLPKAFMAMFDSYLDGEAEI